MKLQWLEAGVFSVVAYSKHNSIVKKPVQFQGNVLWTDDEGKTPQNKQQLKTPVVSGVMVYGFHTWGSN